MKSVGLKWRFAFRWIAPLFLFRFIRLQPCLLPSSSISRTSKRQRATEYRFHSVLLDWRRALAASLCADYLTQLLHSSWDSSVLYSQILRLFKSLRSSSCPPTSPNEIPNFCLLTSVCLRFTTLLCIMSHVN